MTSAPPLPPSPPSSPPSLTSTSTATASTRSVIFRSSLYNNIATVVDDNSLPYPLPILTPPPTPAVHDRSVSQLFRLTLPPHPPPPPPSSSLIANISPRPPPSTPPEEKEPSPPHTPHSPTLRHRYPTRAHAKLQTTSTTTSTVSSSSGSHLPPFSSASPPAPSPIPSDALPPPSSPLSSPYTHRVPPSEIFPSFPFHRKAQPSILSAEASPVNFRGLYNLAGITLFTLTARLVLENLSKYGLMMQMTVVRAVLADPNWGCLVIAGLVCGGSPVVAWALEVLASRRRLSRAQAAWLHAVHVVLVLVVPCVIITWSEASYMSGLVLVLVDMVMTMKLVSYAHVCHDIRSRMLDPVPAVQVVAAVPLPPHLDVSTLHPQLPAEYAPSLGHTFYFMAAPTLIYQLSYPRSASIRLPFLFRRVVELCFCLTLQLLLIEQYLYPTVRNAMHPIQSLNYLSILERILKIALPNGCCWLLLFYSVFHSWLNIVGELLRFSDRLFYRDWWNCQTWRCTGPTGTCRCTTSLCVTCTRRPSARG